MEFKALVRFSGAVLICRLMGFWILLGAAIGIGGAEMGVVEADSAASAGTWYTGLHKQVEPT